MLVDVGDHRGGRRSSSAPEENRRALEDLVGPAQLAVLALELLHPFALLGRQAAALASVDLGLADPQSERFRSDAELLSDAGHRAVAITSLGDRLGDEPDGPFPELGWIPPLGWACVVVVCHDSMFLQTLESPSMSVRFKAWLGEKPSRPKVRRG